MSNGYLALVVVTLIIGLAAQGYVNHKLKKYSNVRNASGMSGAQMARQMLSYYGIHDVEIRRGGPGQDFFDPRSNSVTLSPEAFDACSVTATATACHEVGHACQYAWIFLLMIGIFMNLAGLITAAIIMYAAVVLFQLVTLPVEFNASRRAMAYMGTIGLPPAEQKGAFDVLRACAFTYLAAALTSILQLLWLLGQNRD